MEYIGFALVLIGMSAVESDGKGFMLAAGMMIIGGVMILIKERKEADAGSN